MRNRIFHVYAYSTMLCIYFVHIAHMMHMVVPYILYTYSYCKQCCTVYVGLAQARSNNSFSLARQKSGRAI